MKIDDAIRERARLEFNLPRYTFWEGAENRFKAAVLHLIMEGIYPGPQALNDYIFMHRGRNINGRSCKWRREICKDIGFKLRGLND